MQDVTVICTAGPMKGFQNEFELGQLVVGRLPGPRGLELKGAGSSVSRKHLELFDQDGDVILRNLSPNGTTVNGKLIVDEIRLQPGARVEVGDQFRLELMWKSFGAETIVKKNRPAVAVEKKGPLASPVIRAVLGAYLLGILLVAVWFSLAGDDSTVAADDWPALAEAYEMYAPDTLDEAARKSRAARAQTLIAELRIRRTRGDLSDLDRICRELMSLDGDSASPFFQYGVNCLAAR